MDQPISIEGVEARMQRVRLEIDRLVDICDYDGANIRGEGLDGEFKKRMYVKLIQKFSDLSHEIKYLSKPIIDEGIIHHNESDRYELPSGEYFTSGSVCEILCDWYDDGKMRWVFTSIEYAGQDYYATALGKDVSIDGFTVRIRR